ncbi:hypothetical protein GCM10011611_25300 [Aliidongia dinghuensis]|uniref:Uncharacterized protein n=1 Tax=Aliidongia dinghuensis TaxID=1867774 RepID=A0A8J2YT76_9PROT|nr:hypothetical protein GCM10011611_25300 [Aliidongia dinghuensis]
MAQELNMRGIGGLIWLMVLVMGVVLIAAARGIGERALAPLRRKR